MISQSHDRNAKRLLAVCTRFYCKFITLLSSRCCNTEKEIPVCYFPIDAKVTDEDASAELGRLNMHRTPESINEMRTRIEKARDMVKSWARKQIQHMMCKEATLQALSCGPNNNRVKNYSDLISSFQQAESAAILQKIWQVVYGTFDRNKGWAKDLADRFMSEFGWKYTFKNKPPKKRVYCVERQISLIKNELTKGLNFAVKSTHGKTLRISRKKEEITKATKFKKRKKAMFQPHFITTRVSTITILSYQLIPTLTIIVLEAQCEAKESPITQLSKTNTLSVSGEAATRHEEVVSDINKYRKGIQLHHSQLCSFLFV